MLNLAIVGSTSNTYTKERPPPLELGFDDCPPDAPRVLQILFAGSSFEHATDGEHQALIFCKRRLGASNPNPPRERERERERERKSVGHRVWQQRGREQEIG
jgi:hypothetical protein